MQHSHVTGRSDVSADGASSGLDGIHRGRRQAQQPARELLIDGEYSLAPLSTSGFFTLAASVA
jgi:hypothetical protein